MKAQTHNGIITLHNPKTDGHRTFKIRTNSKDARFAPNERIISLKTPDGWNSLGIIKNNGSVILWNKHRTSKVINKMIHMVMNQDLYEDEIDYLWEGTCRCCNRSLTNPASIHFGVGPICLEKIGDTSLITQWKEWLKIANDVDQRQLEADVMEISINI
jgi:hypothetical protein